MAGKLLPCAAVQSCLCHRDCYLSHDQVYCQRTNSFDWRHSAVSEARRPQGSKVKLASTTCQPCQGRLANVSTVINNSVVLWYLLCPSSANNHIQVGNGSKKDLCVKQAVSKTSSDWVILVSYWLLYVNLPSLAGFLKLRVFWPLRIGHVACYGIVFCCSCYASVSRECELLTHLSSRLFFLTCPYSCKQKFYYQTARCWSPFTDRNVYAAVDDINHCLVLCGIVWFGSDVRLHNLFGYTHCLFRDGLKRFVLLLRFCCTYFGDFAVWMLIV